MYVNMYILSQTRFIQYSQLYLHLVNVTNEQLMNCSFISHT